MKQKLSVHYRGVGTFTCKEYMPRRIVSGIASISGKEFIVPQRHVVKIQFDRSLKELTEAIMNEKTMELTSG